MTSSPLQKKTGRPMRNSSLPWDPEKRQSEPRIPSRTRTSFAVWIRIRCSISESRDVTFDRFHFRFLLRHFRFELTAMKSRYLDNIIHIWSYINIFAYIFHRVEEDTSGKVKDKFAIITEIGQKPLQQSMLQSEVALGHYATEHHCIDFGIGQNSYRM